MVKFETGKRVIVTDKQHPCYGMAGTVYRLLMRMGGEAWIDMDHDIPDEAARFPIEDERRNHVCLFPEQAKGQP